MGSTHPFERRSSSRTARHSRPATRRHPDPVTSPDHIGVVRIGNEWIVHSSLEDDPPVAADPSSSRRIAGRR
jgi:hypothetical protein